MEMSYLRGACGVTRREGESNESMGLCANGVKCGVVEWVKINTLRWFDHLEREKSEGFVKNVYVSETEDPKRRGMPVVRWKNKVTEYMH